MRGRDETPWFGAGLILAVAWGALAFGAVYRWAYVPLLFLCSVLGIWGAVAGHAWHDPRTRKLTIALAATGGAIALQLVALPFWLLAYVSPGVERFLRQFTVAYHPSSLHTLSIAPASTVVALIMFVGLSILLVGATRSIRSVGLEWFVAQLMGLGAALALLGVVQQAFLDKDDPLVYGFWRPSYGAAPYGPFINKNHFAGWMVMVLPLVAGYAYALFHQARQPGERGTGAWMRWLVSVDASRFVMVSTVALVMSLAVVLTGSRSGIASLVIAFGVLGVAMWRSLRRTTGRRLLVPAYLGLMVIGALAWGGIDTLAARFANAPAEAEGRLSAWRDSATILRQFPLFGTGLGTYSHAMLVYQTSNRASMYAQAHNDYIQLAVEGGLFVGVPAIVVVVILVQGIRRRLGQREDDLLTEWIRMGAVAGLVGIAAQSFVEFSLQMPGNAVLFVILLALALHRPARLSHAHRV